MAVSGGNFCNRAATLVRRSTHIPHAVWSDLDHWENSPHVQSSVKQGSGLVELRLTWREMENLSFGNFRRIFGEIIEDFLRNFEEIGSLLEEGELPLFGEQ